MLSAPARSPARRAGRRLSAGLWRAIQAVRSSPRPGLALVLLLALAADAWAFGHLVEDYLTGDPLVDWDVRFARWLHEHADASLVSAFKVVTLAGNGVVLAALVVAVGFALLRRGRANDALLLGLVFAGSELLNGAMKLAFHRPRPELAFVHLETYSFPSGHAAVSAAVYGVLAVLAVRRLTGAAARAGAILAAVVLVGLIGFSRLYLGVHYLSDVLVGLTVGIGWTLAFGLVLCLGGRLDLTATLPRPLRRLVLALAPRR